MKKITFIAVCIAMVLPFLTSIVETTANGALVTAVSRQDGELNPLWPDDVPEHVIHIIVYPDGRWAIVDGLYDYLPHIVASGVHLSRDGSPPPWGRSSADVLVRVSDIFRNENENKQPLNGAFVDAARRFVSDVRHSQNHVGIDTNIRMTQAELQRSDNLMRDFVAGAEDDPAVLDILGTCLNGLKLQLDGMSVRTFTAHSDDFLGMFDSIRREFWVATHIRQEDSSVVPINESDILDTLLYEIFGRGQGFGIAGSRFIAETFLEIGPTHDAWYWPSYSGFMHRLSDVAGSENVFRMLRGDQNEFARWANGQIRVMNPNFNFTYDQLQLATGGVGAIIRNRNHAQSHFLASTGIHEASHIWTYLGDAWQHFYDATNSSLSTTERNQAAQRFNNIVEQLYTLTTENEFIIGQGGSQAVLGTQQLPSILEFGQPIINLNNLQAGVQTRLAHESGINSQLTTMREGVPVQFRRPGSIFSEVPRILANLERQVQAGYILQNEAWIQISQQPQILNATNMLTETTTTEHRILRFLIDTPHYTDNGTSHTLEAAPFIADDRTMVPLRVISEALGAKDIVLNDGVVSLTLNGRVIAMVIGQPLPNNMGTPIIIAGRTFVPLAYIVEKMGAEVYWDGNTRAIYITIV